MSPMPPMPPIYRLILSLVIALTLPSAPVARASTQTPTAPAFQPVAKIALPDGRWDYASFDADHHRVLVAHGQDVLLIDPAGGGAVRAIGMIAGAHQALAIPNTDTLLVTSGHDASVRILDATSGAELARIIVPADPDGAILSPDGRTAYVMGGDSGVVSIIDLAARAVTGQIALKPGLEGAIVAGPHLLAINNEPLHEIELADLATGKAGDVIALPGCEGPTGLAYAPEQGMMLSACGNGVAALVDLAQRRLVALLRIGQGPDAAIWQAAHHRFLVPCGRSGTLAIIRLDGRRAHVEPSITTEISARTAALDPHSAEVFLPAARFQPGAAQRHPPIMPGSFHLLVMAP